MIILQTAHKIGLESDLHGQLRHLFDGRGRSAGRAGGRVLSRCRRRPIAIPDDPRPAVHAFATKFKQTFGIDVNYLGEAGYTAANFSLAALEKAGRDLTADSFIAAMESMKDWHDIFEGPPLSLSPTNHHASNQSFLSVVKDTRWAPVLQEPLSF